MFADDCTLYREVKCKDDCIQLQNDLTRIYNWSQIWQLHLNTSKCKALCISNKKALPSQSYYINNGSLEWVEQFKYLGVCINQHLTWGNHIAYDTHKSSRILNLLRRTMYSCNKTSKKMAVTALVRPHLEYCAPVWSPHYTKDKLALEKVQKRAAHWICSKWDNAKYKWNKSYGQALSELQWPTVLQRHTLLGCCQTFTPRTVLTLANTSVLSPVVLDTIHKHYHVSNQG